MGHQRSVLAPFLTKTYDLVDDRSSDDAISWNETGTAFVVWKTAEFAKDLLPNYFKHNNFSSFVRQLNTYGFRKTVSDKWEFANENFKRGEKDLLASIRRRKIASTLNTATAKPVIAGGFLNSPAISGDELASSSVISSPNSKNLGSLEGTQSSPQNQIADLSDENEKLRKDNQTLSSDLSQTKKKCDELIAYLTNCMNVAPEQIHRIIGGGGVEGYSENFDFDENGEGCVKLFGVMVKKKRGRSENIDFFGPQRKEIKSSVV